MNNFQRASQLRADGKFEEGFLFLKLAVEEDKDIDAIYEYKQVSRVGGWGVLPFVYQSSSSDPNKQFYQSYELSFWFK
jgi:hypothetical protein